MKTFDVIVIGSGGGSKITSPAAKMGLRVACIEKGPLGGTCLNRGCIPSKMLIHPAEIAQHIREKNKFDLLGPSPIEVNFPQLVTRISATVDRDSQSIAAGYARNPQITYLPHEGRFIADKTLLVNGEQITADKIFISVGARPHIPNIPGLSGTPFMTSTEALRNTHLPKRMIVIGGGYIAVELGFAYAALGTDVHFLVRRTLLRHEDHQVQEEFTRIFTQHHRVSFNAVPERVEYHNQEFTVTYKHNGEAKQVTAQALLIATGVVPNTDTLNLGATRIQCDEQGFIKVDDQLQTAVPGVYAFGDCIGRYLYRHSANFEGEYLFENVFQSSTAQPIIYPAVGHAVFSYPQVAGVGLTEEQARAKGLDFVVGLNAYQSSAMGMARLSDHGFVKMIIERSSRRILGAHIVGDEASNMIHMLIAFMLKDATLDDLLKMIYIHPALPEIVRNAARKAKLAL